GAERGGGGAANWRGWSEHYSGVFGQPKVIAFGKERRILPKALGTLAPGRIVIDGIAAANDGLVATKELISETDAWLKGRPSPIYACRRAHTTLIGNQKLARAS